MCWCWETLPARPDLELIQSGVSLAFLGQKLTLCETCFPMREKIQQGREQGFLPSLTLLQVFPVGASHLSSPMASLWLLIQAPSHTLSASLSFALPSTWALDGPPVAQHQRASWARCTLPIRSLELTGDSLPLQPAGLLWLSIQCLTPLLWF